MLRGFNFLSPIPDHLICSICQDIIKNPSKINCGHSYCMSCLEPWLETNYTCPLCRRNSHKDHIVYDIITAIQYDNLKVSCANIDCSWTGTVKESGVHEFICEEALKRMRLNLTNKSFDLLISQNAKNKRNDLDYMEKYHLEFIKEFFPPIEPFKTYHILGHNI